MTTKTAGTETDRDDPANLWRCFHCDEVFYSRETAAEHFGYDESCTPACKLSGTARHLVSIIRDQERELRSYRSEDTKLLRAIWSMEADNRQALIREEEKGYNRGVRDATDHPTSPHTRKRQITGRSALRVGAVDGKEF